MGIRVYIAGTYGVDLADLVVGVTGGSEAVGTCATVANARLIAGGKAIAVGYATMPWVTGWQPVDWSGPVPYSSMVYQDGVNRCVLIASVGGHYHSLEFVDGSWESIGDHHLDDGATIGLAVDAGRGELYHLLRHRTLYVPVLWRRSIHRVWEQFDTPDANFALLGDGFCCAYDRTNDQLVCFGPMGAPAEAQFRTAVWDRATKLWSYKSPSTRPSKRLQPCMLWDPSLNKIVLIGGKRLSDDAYLNDVWFWDGTDWDLQAPAPLLPDGRYKAFYCYDPTRSGIVMWGGENASGTVQDAWLLVGGNTWSAVSSGFGCQRLLEPVV